MFASFVNPNPPSSFITQGNPSVLFTSMYGGGTRGANGATWLFGSGAPSIGLGNDGDIYLDTATENLYQKISGVWSVETNIKGATGPPGATGPKGDTGFGVQTPIGADGTFLKARSANTSGSEWAFLQSGDIPNNAANTSGSADSFTGTLAGDVIGTQGATAVAFVGSASASSVALATGVVGAATASNTASTLVLRDGSGDFAAGTITAALNGNATSVTNGVYTTGAGTVFLAPNGNGSGLTSLTGANVSGNIPGNAANVTGTVAIGSGGTGQVAANAALNALLPSQTGNAGKTLGTNGTDASWGSAGSGTVTSVAMTGDGVIFNSSVTGSPVTTSGTLVPSLISQVANRVLAGPAAGGNAAPTFRVLTAADIPAKTVTPSSTQVDLNGIWTIRDTNIGATTIAATTKPSSPQLTYTLVAGDFVGGNSSVDPNAYVGDTAFIWDAYGQNTNVASRTINWRFCFSTDGGLTWNDLGASDGAQSITGSQYWRLASATTPGLLLVATQLVAGNLLGIKLWGSVTNDLNYIGHSLYGLPRKMASQIWERGLATVTMTVNGALGGVTYLGVAYNQLPSSPSGNMTLYGPSGATVSSGAGGGLFFPPLLLSPLSISTDVTQTTGSSVATPTLFGISRTTWPRFLHLISLSI